MSQVSKLLKDSFHPVKQAKPLRARFMRLYEWSRQGGREGKNAIPPIFPGFGFILL